MKIYSINSQPVFTGNVYTMKNLSLFEMDKLQKGAGKLCNYAKNKKFDYIIFRNGEQKGVSILAKALEEPKREVFEVIGYPSGSEIKDINLILDTMKQATEKLSQNFSSIFWSCE